MRLDDAEARTRSWTGGEMRQRQMMKERTLDFTGTSKHKFVLEEFRGRNGISCIYSNLFWIVAFVMHPLHERREGKWGTPCNLAGGRHLLYLSLVYRMHWLPNRHERLTLCWFVTNEVYMDHIGERVEHGKV